MPVPLSERVSRPGSYPNALFFGALFGTESHKALRDTGVGNRTIESREWKRRLDPAQQQQSSCSAQERGVYGPFLALLYITCLHIKALGRVLIPYVLARG